MPEITIQRGMADDSPRLSKARSASLLRQTLGRTFDRWGARIGLAWIVLLVLLSVFAPLIANSMPIVAKIDGRWQSPLLQHLTPADVVLFAAFIAVVAALPFRRFRMTHRLLAALAVTIIAIPLAYSFVHPPRIIVYDRYRTMAAKGVMTDAILTPIPYSPNDYMRDMPNHRLIAPWWHAGAGGPADNNHWLGTDTNGADIASRMIHACRIALSVGFVATGIALVIGVVVGGFMGYFSGIVDLIGMRIVEIIEFIPTLFLLLMFVAFFDRNIYLIMSIIGLTGWTGYARFIRAEFLKLRQQDFVQAAVATGLPLRSILFRHMLPNGIAPVLVSASFGVAGAILAEATLSFLGLGLVNEPSWGQLLNQATGSTGSFAWWIAIFPGAAIFLTVFAYNLVGEALRDAIDPHVQR